MYSDWAWSAIGGFLALWLLVLSILVLRQSSFLRSLFPRSGERDIRRKFEEVLDNIQEFKLGADELRKKIREVEKSGLGYIQRIKLLRYNPYGDTGGDQSFSLALLDKEGSGIVITSLHARSGTRVFAKQVIRGETAKHEFSEEEKIAIEQAIKNL